MKTLITITGLLVLLGKTKAKGDINEKKILQEFYQETGGASWNINTGWEEESEDICQWHGVVCEGQPVDEDETSRKLEDNSITIPHSNKGRVIELKLDSNNLIGRVPPSLWSLPNLRNLHLSYNKVDVSFAGDSDSLIEVKLRSTSTTSVVGITRFPNLLSLQMSGTPLGNVQFPKEILKLTELRQLHMNSCEMEGRIPDEIVKLTKLREFNIMDNEFIGSIPGGLESLKSLKILSLSRNHFGGILPEWLGELEDLEELYLEENQLTGELIAFDSQSSLRRLYLNDNELTENIPADFLISVTPPKKKGQVIRVNLDNNNLGDIVPASLNKLVDLPLKLSLSGNKFTSFASTTTCGNTKWQDNLVETYGCDAILCPVGRYSPLGRRTKSNNCQGCESGFFLGQKTCVDQDDKRALRSLYLETGGDHWHKNNGWLEDGVDVCDWFGITCYENDIQYSGRVKIIDLANNGLIGRVPESIYAMNALTKINLSWNRIVFQFSSLSKSTSLHILNIGHTDTTSFEGIEEGNSFFKYFMADHLGLDGTIPKEILGNTHLRVLSLANCGITGTIGTEIGALKDLEELYLWGNNLRGSIPDEVAELKNLEILTLAKNQFTGTLPERLEELMKLKAFAVTDQITKGGGLTGDLLPFQYNPHLKDVFLGKNKFEGTIPLTMLNSVDIAESIVLDLSFNLLTGTLPGTFQKFDQMDIFVQDNMISRVDQALCKKRDWMYGGVGEWGCEAILCPAQTYNDLGRVAFDTMTCHDCEENQHIGQTQCGKKTPVLTEKQILESLYDNCNGKYWLHQENWMNTGRHYCEWSGISCDDAKSIVAIVLGSNGLSGSLPTEVYSLPNLKRLFLFDNEVAISFDGIENAKNLESMVLDSTIVSSIVGIGNARSLTELNLRSIKLTGTLPSELSNLNNLEKLTLSNNNLNGPLPAWLSKLNKLTTLMLENNQISGKLMAFQYYEHITLLSLSNNKLSGPIPTQFLKKAYKDDKVFVDLSGNMLTGTLPRELSHMNRLSIILKDNKISEIDAELCKMNGWNDYDVQQHGCDGILCPKGTFADRKGRASGSATECVDCSKTNYMGSSKCASYSRVRSGAKQISMKYVMIFTLSFFFPIAVL
eukprot:CAMPEP_0194147756 /NCGR_PEP_ID=MMETSP0152-20130528/27565_1 /TAXON_ID=1049557 /ORGANISM="Thalassiothrix antarctica, Strain L6-D1" /LENGTH=1116 /DNA_ID=CAMNT_0038848801 /DNA_START=119 /DNA_END=3469 /DNA_ORIENTATION=-